MTAQRGALVLIKVGNGGDPENFTTIGGLRAARMVLDAQALDNSDLESGAWRRLLAGGGIRSVMLGGSGLFTDSAAEETLRGYAFAGAIHNYRFVFANGDSLAGA